MVINFWLDDTFTQHATLEDALRAFKKSPYDLSECWERDPEQQSCRVYSQDEMAALAEEIDRQIETERWHNKSLQAAE